MTPHSTSAFDSLHTKYEKLVQAICSRSLRGYQSHVQDVAQTVWLEAWTACQAGQQLSKAWLVLRTQSRCMDLREKLGLDPDSLDDLTETDDPDAGNQIDQIMSSSSSGPRLDRGLVEYIRAGIEQLPPRTAEILTLFYYSARTIPEIAAALKISEGTVKWHLSTGRDELRSMFLPAEPQKEVA